MQTILLATSDQETIEIFKKHFEKKYKVFHATDFNSCYSEFQKRRHEFTFLDLSFIEDNLELEKRNKHRYKKVLQTFWKIFPTAPIIILSLPEHLRKAVNAVREGANNYLVYPIEPSEVQLVIENEYQYLKMATELKSFREEFWQSTALDVVQTNSLLMQKVFEAVKQVAPTLMNVLIMGETGTGKGRVAQLIHQHSERHDKPFVHVHCGAIPDTLLESELFGHEKGAFTHAIQRKLGKFEIANGGTIFLDEVGTMTQAAQVKLLQVLQDKIFQRVGGVHDLKADIRIIAASNVDLKQLSDTGKFRSDLYYRLNVFSLTIPPLRERPEDIQLLGEQFLNKFNQIYPKTIRGFQPEVMAAFQKYHWPGNIRELENLIERAYILEETSIFTPSSFPSDLFLFDNSIAVPPPSFSLGLSDAREQAVSVFEQEYLKRLLTAHRGHVNQSAKAAQITPRQLHRMMSKYNIKKEIFKEPTL